MPYYGRGDYYRGDYYRGDLLGALGRVVRGAVRSLPGPAGVIARAVVPEGSAAVPSVARVPNLPAPAFEASGQVERFQGIRGSLVTGSPQGQVVMGTMAGAKGCTIKGYHLNKSGYYRRTPTGGVTYIEKNSACVRNRHMNPTNGRALRRALRRATSFKKIAIRTIRLIDPTRKAKKFGGFKTRKGKS